MTDDNKQGPECPECSSGEVAMTEVRLVPKKGTILFGAIICCDDCGRTDGITGKWLQVQPGLFRKRGWTSRMSGSSMTWLCPNCSESARDERLAKGTADAS